MYECGGEELGNGPGCKSTAGEELGIDIDEAAIDDCEPLTAGLLNLSMSACTLEPPMMVSAIGESPGAELGTEEHDCKARRSNLSRASLRRDSRASRRLAVSAKSRARAALCFCRRWLGLLITELEHDMAEKGMREGRWTGSLGNATTEPMGP